MVMVMGRPPCLSLFEVQNPAPTNPSHPSERIARAVIRSMLCTDTNPGPDTTSPSTGVETASSMQRAILC